LVGHRRLSRGSEIRLGRSAQGARGGIITSLTTGLGDWEGTGMSWGVVGFVASLVPGAIVLMLASDVLCLPCLGAAAASVKGLWGGGLGGRARARRAPGPDAGAARRVGHGWGDRRSHPGGGVRGPHRHVRTGDGWSCRDPDGGGRVCRHAVEVSYGRVGDRPN